MHLILGWSFFIYPMVTSMGFNSLAHFECWDDTDGRTPYATCFLKYDLRERGTYTGPPGEAEHHGSQNVFLVSPTTPGLSFCGDGCRRVRLWVSFLYLAVLMYHRHEIWATG